MEEVQPTETRINPVEITTTFTVRINHLNKWLDNKKFNKMMDAWGVKSRKCKKIAGQEFAFVTFNTEEERDKCKEILDGKEVDGHKLSVAEKKRTFESEDQDSKNKRQRFDKPKPNQPKTIQEAVTPLWNVPYPKQLEMKKESTVQIFKNIIHKVRDACSWKMPIWLRGSDAKFGELESVKGSPTLTGYRNKCSFTIGFDANDKPMIGFQLGKTEKGTFTVEDPAPCINIPDVGKKIRNSFQEYVEKSPWKPYNKKERHGFWRELTLRCYTTGDVMAIFQINPTGLSEEEIQKEKQGLIDHMKANDLHITSLVVQINNSVSDVCDTPHQVIFGPPFVTEKLLGLTFQIGPSAFFQVNTLAAEVLYDTIRDWAQLDKDTTVLDICCGTGTIGITMAGLVKQVIGIEMVPEAVENAKQNAKINGITNAHYFVGKAEEVLHHQLSALRREKCVAIVDPPRAGLHGKVVQAIRNCPAIKYLVFVSCDKSGLIDNSVGFCRPTSKTMKGPPFKPIKAVGVDLFPWTELVERVVLFERLPDDEGKPSDKENGSNQPTTESTSTTTSASLKEEEVEASPMNKQEAAEPVEQQQE